ncbi:MAG: FtsW/RodA/SpoVE family cell cycle protein [Phycisphaerae bacterium]|nr:FtsW/RodA/SpoVE family cell cycle protein [Phycisphaerae bacterium]
MNDTTARTLPLIENPPGRGVILTALGLLALGVVMVHSAVMSVGESSVWYARVDMRHTLFAVMAAGVLLVGWRMNYRWLGAGPWLPWLSLGLLIVAIGLGCLVFVPGVGHSVGGKFRWIRLGPRQYSIGLQPSELIKLALIVFLACWLTRRGKKVRNFWTFLIAGGLTGGCMALVVTQDFGTAGLIGVSAGVVMFLAGVPWYYLAGSVAASAGAFFYIVIDTPFRLQRILAMLDPWDATNNSTYQVRQSLMAIFGGQWTGRGLGLGVRKLGFLPEDSTDFIFASFCEEWGFRGAVLLMGLLLIWLWHTRRTAARAGDELGRVLAAGLGIMVALQAIMHIAVNLNALPPTGISLPFVSAGGTSLVITAVAATLIASVSARPAGETIEE